MTSIISLIYTNAQQAPLQLYLQIYIYSIYNVAEGQPELIFYVFRFAQLVLPSILGYFFALEIHDHDRSYSKCYAEFYIPSVFKVGQQQVSNFKLKIINY